MTRLILVRHGESNVTVQRRIGGLQTCSGLSELGHRQAQALAERLSRTGELEPDVLVSSTMPRAMETAHRLATTYGIQVDLDAAMCEHAPGDVDGMRFDEYVARYGRHDWTDPDADVFPGGETLRQFHARVTAGVDRLLDRFRDQRIVVVCHGGVIDAVLRHLLGLAMSGGFELHTLNTSITELRFRPSVWRLVRYNDAAHLEGLPTETPQTEIPHEGD